MATHNDITGDALVSRRSNDAYRNNYDAIFGKKDKKPTASSDEPQASAQEPSSQPQAQSSK